MLRGCHDVRNHLADRVVIEMQAELLVRMTEWQVRASQEIIKLKQRMDLLEARLDELEELATDPDNLVKFIRRRA